MLLDEKARAELRALSKSDSLRADMRKVAEGRSNPLLVDGEVSLERLVDLLTEHNEFLNHPIKPFRRPIEKNMKL